MDKYKGIMDGWIYKADYMLKLLAVLDIKNLNT
jgi:hypothetical protein